MPTIVEQLQADALNAAVPVSSLLRKVKLAAVKLGLPIVEDWVTSELNGYGGSLPDYRKVPGHPHVLNPARGWMPMQGAHKIIDKLSEAHVRQSIASLESLLNGKDSIFYMAFPAELTESLNQMMDYPWPKIGQALGRCQSVGMLDSVRTMVLDWALELEKQGIMGSEIGFAASEKKLAHEKQVHIHIGTIANFTGVLNADVGGENSRLNIGSNDSSTNRA